MPGKPPGMDPIGIMGRHDGAGATALEGWGLPGARAGAAQLGRSIRQYVGQGLPPGALRGQV